MLRFLNFCTYHLLQRFCTYSCVFFNLIDEGKSVYLLSPNTKIAETPEHFKQTAHLGGFDGVRLMEIDGTNSTIQITNFDKLTHVIG